MKKFTIGLFVLVVAILSLAPSSPTHAAVANWQKGISVQSRYADDFGSSSFRQSIDAAARDGVNYVTLVIPVHQDNIHSNYVYAGSDTPTDSALRSGLNYLHSKNIGAAIAVHDNPYDYQWRALISASDLNTWFSSYGTLLNHYAELGQSSGMTQMIIGTELSSMTVAANTERWNGLIAGVRQRFGGSLTYSAQHMGYMSDAQSLGFWPQLDKIGISAYYSLGGDTSIQALQGNWDKWNQLEVSVLAARYNKPVVFTEVGYVSRDGSTNDPGTGYTLGTGVNTGVQANAYAALFQYWNNYDTIGGVYFWDWSSDPNAGGSGDGGYTPQNKPAEAVLKQWYGAPAAPTSPAQPPTAESYTASATLPTNSQTNQAVTLPVQLSSTSSASDRLVDLEVYNAAGQQVAQKYFEHQNIPTGTSSYDITFTPTNAGQYSVKVGVFTAGWQKNLYWNGSVASLAVAAVAVPAPTPPPAPTPVPAPTPTPAAPPATSLPKAITIWWPGGTVSGVQPYKAIVDGRDASTYDIFWQVDNGTLNKLGDNTNPIAHKESLVDMTNWHWSSSNQYVINFVAKDKQGAILSQKAVTLTLTY